MKKSNLNHNKSNKASLMIKLHLIVKKTDFLSKLYLKQNLY